MYHYNILFIKTLLKNQVYLYYSQLISYTNIYETNIDIAITVINIKK